jgi:hypothetical protein
MPTSDANTQDRQELYELSSEAGSQDGKKEEGLLIRPVKKCEKAFTL